MVAGALLLLLVPAVLLFYALSDPKNAQIPGTLVILSVVVGMALVVVGAALRDE
jgi:Flp pilus assembly protein protease CpaA